MKEKFSQPQWQLRGLWVGIGCKKGSSRQLIAAAIDHIFRENKLDESAMGCAPLEAIAGFATIDTKASEVGLVELCHLYNLPLRTFPAAVLSSVCVPNPAKITEKQVGTPSVAEAAAILAASHLTPLLTTDLVSEKAGLDVILLVPKQIFCLQGQPGIVTVAVTQDIMGNLPPIRLISSQTELITQSHCERSAHNDCKYFCPSTYQGIR